ncbi:uncharacterized protein LOC143074906 [Mytilus galloprovincialis]|uniref:uncharacterized protein LOC143074906 n=1 Tax=Mytilus galloprovincialis TaxID=29158 RepID=UPI003F7C61D6
MMIEQWKILGYKAVPSQPSSTSLPQQWDKPRGPKSKAEPVSQMIISRPMNLTRKRKPVIATFIDNRNIEVCDEDIIHLKQLKLSPISYLVEELGSSTTLDTPVGPQLLGSPLSYHKPLMTPIFQPREENSDICGDIVFPKPLPQCIDMSAMDQMKTEWFASNITKTEAITIEKETRKQSNSTAWFQHRENRITASNFGAVMLRKKDINDKFLKNTFKRKQFTSLETSYGTSNETIAKQMYIKQSGNHTHDIGLVVQPDLPFIGSTPDAVVCDKTETGIVEIKCPYSVRNMTLKEACDERADFFLKPNASGDSFTLIQDHKHWFQVQGQLLTTGAPFCDFVTYTKQDIGIERIYSHEITIKALVDKLSKFYIQHFKPYMNK